MTATSTSNEPPWLFIVVLFAVAIAVGVTISYLGITGMIGGPIP